MKVFISGGCKNGKSYHARRMAKAQSGGRLYYVATMLSTGEEDDARILRHRGEREGLGFETIEQPRDINELLDKCDTGGSFLVDSTTALLANEMFLPSGEVNRGAEEKIRRGLGEILSRVSDIVIVSDYIFSDALMYDPLTEEYRRALAGIDRECAGLCDAVLEISFSEITVHRGGEQGHDADYWRGVSGKAELCP